MSDRFALKGGMLLSAYHARRTTRDADLSGIGISVAEDDVVAVMAGVAGTAVEDGVEFLVDQVRSRAIREDGPYGGTRVVIPARVARFQASIQIDVSSGDPIVPGVRRIDFPQQLGDCSFELLAYPIETVLAEKILTALEGETPTHGCVTTPTCGDSLRAMPSPGSGCTTRRSNRRVIEG